MRYQFHALDQRVGLNIEAAELPGYEAAVERARALARQLVRQQPYARSPAAWEITVTDGDGEEVLSMRLLEASGD